MNLLNSRKAAPTCVSSPPIPEGPPQPPRTPLLWRVRANPGGNGEELCAGCAVLLNARSQRRLLYREAMLRAGVFCPYDTWTNRLGSYATEAANTREEIKELATLHSSQIAGEFF